jgi:hypothetical protein
MYTTRYNVSLKNGQGEIEEVWLNENEISQELLDLYWDCG